VCTSPAKVDTGEKAGSPSLPSTAAESISAESGPRPNSNLQAMTEPSPSRRDADVNVRAPGWPWEALEDLEAQELQLYALGWGDHLPVEVRERIETIRQRKLALETELQLRLLRPETTQAQRPLEVEPPVGALEPDDAKRRSPCD
jgi:hypothetical protein